jgi:hypothetical protein
MHKGCHELPEPNFTEDEHGGFLVTKIWGSRPSASMVVAVLALVIAASGTAMAAGHLVNGDKLIAQHSLSGNRLRNQPRAIASKGPI